MSVNVGAGYIDIVPNIAGGWQQALTTDVDRVTKGIAGKFNSTFRNIAAAAGGIFVGQKVFDFLGDSVDAGRESIKISKLTEAGIKSTGGVANVTAKHISDYAEELSNLTGVDDELIQSGENLLLTFTNVRNEAGKGNKIFDRATKASLDLSARGFGSVESASVMLGKALNDPLQGITALGRAGVTFTEGQKAQIEGLVENNDLLAAQGIILDEVGRQVGGSAEAAATPMDRLKVTVGNLQEQLGAYLIPKIDTAAAWLADHLPAAIETGLDKLGELRDFFRDEINPRLETFGGIVNNYVITPIGDMVEFFQNNDPALKGVATTVGVLLAGAFTAYAASAALAAVSTILALLPVILVIAAVAALAAGLWYAYENWGWFRTGVDGAIDVLGLLIDPIDELRGILQKVADLIVTIVSGFKKLKEAIPDLGKIPGLGGLGGLLGSAGRLAFPGAAALGGLLGFDTGGTVPGPIGAPQLAVVHGGETVVPTHQPGFDAGSLGGTTYVVNNYNPAPQPASDSTERALQRVKLRMGGL